VLDERDEHPLHRAAVAGVAQQNGHHRIQLQGVADLVLAVPRAAVEAVHRDEERDAQPAEVVDRHRALEEAVDVGEHHGAERPGGDLVPHHPDLFDLWRRRPGAVELRRAEEVHDDVVTDSDPPQVDRRGRVFPDPDHVQWTDLTDGPDECRLSDTEGAGNENLQSVRDG
jgi:hypothetical protein